MLRGAGIVVEFEIMGRKMTKALEDADKRKVDYAIIIGERELKEGSVMLKNLAKREQTTVPIKDLAEKIKD
jgi:histidyl-tRNA synthetase